MTYDEMLALAEGLNGRVLETVTGRQFTVGVYMRCPYFTPLSTGLGRSDGRPAAERFLQRYNETGSLRPRDYKGLTQNASYFVGMMAAVETDGN